MKRLRNRFLQKHTMIIFKKLLMFLLKIGKQLYQSILYFLQNIAQVIPAIANVLKSNTRHQCCDGLKYHPYLSYPGHRGTNSTRVNESLLHACTSSY